MPIAKMKRLQVLALERDHDALLRQLERMGCVEISEPDAPDAPESLRRCDSETADCLARQRQVQTAIDALRRAAPPKKAPLLAPRPAIGEAEYLSETGLADGLALARQVNEAAGQLQQLTALAAQLETDRITLGPWLSLDLPLELTETRCCDVTLGVLPPFVPWDELCGQVQNEYPESELHLLSADRQQQCVLLITHKAATAPVLELLRGRGFAASPLKGSFFSEHYIRRITYFPPAVSASYIPSAHFLFHSPMTSFRDLCPQCDCPSAVSIRSTWYCEPLSRSSSEALFTLVHFPLLSTLAALFAMRSMLSNS